MNLNEFLEIQKLQQLNEYIEKIKGYKNSKGKDAPWIIKSHEDDRILASFATKEEAEAHLKRMKAYSK